MQVLLLDLGSESQNGQAQTALLARALSRSNLTFVVACPCGSDLANSLEGTDIPVLALPGHSLFNPIFLWTFERAKRQYDIRIVHALGRPAARAAFFFKRLHREKLLLLQSRRDSIRAQIRPRLYVKADAVTCPTPEMIEQTKTMGVLADKVHLLPFGVDETRYSPRRPREDGRFVFLCLAPLQHESGLSVLLEAMSLIHEMEDLPPWEVRIAGSGPLFQSLLDQAVQFKVESHLAILGDQNPAVLLPDCDILLAPNLESEAGGLSVKQAWASRVPVVCSSVRSHADLVTDKQDALLVPVGNPVALASTMVRCIREPTLRERLSQGGNLRLPAFNADAIAQTTLKIYRYLENRHPRQPMQSIK